MARIRTVKPEFWTDEKIVELTPWARLLFLGLLNFADDEGRLVNSPKRLKMQILPADSVSIPGLLTELDGQGLVRFYTVKQAEYIEIVNFAKHQKINHPSKTTLPGPELPESSGSAAVRNGMEGKGREGKKTESSLRSDSPVLDLRSFPEDSLGQSVKNLQGKTLGALAFDAYALAYLKRYSVAPVVNAKVRGQFSKLAKDLGADAVAVAGYYVTHSGEYYTRRGHEPGALLADAGKLRTEWATGRQVGATRKLSAVELVVDKARETANRSLIPQLPEVKNA